MSRSSVIVAAGLASGTYLFANQAFVTPMQGSKANKNADNSPSLSTMDPAQVTEVGTLGSTSSVATAVGLAGMFAAVASTHRRGSRTLRRAEPITVAAATAAAKAAGAAKAAAAAKGGAKVAGAVAGSSATSTMVDASNENPGDFDPEVGGKSSWSPASRGTPELKKAMDQKRQRNEKAWEVYTGRNPEGNFGDADNAKKNVDPYDPFATIGNAFTQETGSLGFEIGEFNPAVQVGVTEPLGYFDPLGFCSKGDEQGFRRLRTAEIKHGRVAMMGALGAVVQHYVKFPGFEKVPAGLSAVNEAPGTYGAIALFLATGALELFVWTESDNKEPGNFGDPANFCGIGDGYTVEMRNRELNNGRAAMFAVMGIIVAELYTGKDAIEQFGLQ